MDFYLILPNIGTIKMPVDDEEEELNVYIIPKHLLCLLIGFNFLPFKGRRVG